MFVKGHGRRGDFTQEDYAAQVINAVVKPFFLKTRLFNVGQFVLYEDGNSAHELIVNSIENAARRCKEAWNITYVASPLSSSDFNVIENIWRIIKSRIKAYERSITTIEDMKAAVQAEWDKITIEDIRKLIRTMPERMQQAHKRNGYGTKFWIASNHVFRILVALKLHVWCSLAMRIEIWVGVPETFGTHLVRVVVAIIKA